MHSRATDRRSASKCQGKWPDQTLDQAFGLPEVLVAVSTSRLSCKRAGKTRTLMPVWDSSGESRFMTMLALLSSIEVAFTRRGVRMRRSFAAITALACLVAPASVLAENAYITNLVSANVSGLDTATKTQIPTIPVGIGQN